MKQFFAIFILASVVIAFSACNKSDNSLEKMRESELAMLDEFMRTNYPNEEPTPSGLYYIEQIEGHGDSLIRPGDRVQVFYATYTLDSILVDESSGYTNGHRFEPLEFVVGAGTTISGMEEGVTYMKLGGKATMVINSELAYGQNGTGSVGGFTTLFMEVEVFKVYPFIVPEEEE
jgi:FKBP-type peptidyl-prolyl cis-trans isomerase FkpA